MIDRPDADTALRGILLRDMETEQLAGLVTCAASRDMESAVNSPLLEGCPPPAG